MAGAGGCVALAAWSPLSLAVAPGSSGGRGGGPGQGVADAQIQPSLPRPSSVPVAVANTARSSSPFTQVAESIGGPGSRRSPEVAGGSRLAQARPAMGRTPSCVPNLPGIGLLHDDGVSGAPCPPSPLPNCPVDAVAVASSPPSPASTTVTPAGGQPSLPFPSSDLPTDEVRLHMAMEVICRLDMAEEKRELFMAERSLREFLHDQVAFLQCSLGEGDIDVEASPTTTVADLFDLKVAQSNVLCCDMEVISHVQPIQTTVQAEASSFSVDVPFGELDHKPDGMVAQCTLRVACDDGQVACRGPMAVQPIHTPVAAVVYAQAQYGECGGQKVAAGRHSPWSQSGREIRSLSSRFDGFAKANSLKVGLPMKITKERHQNKGSQVGPRCNAHLRAWSCPRDIGAMISSSFYGTRMFSGVVFFLVLWDVSGLFFLVLLSVGGRLSCRE